MCGSAPFRLACGVFRAQGLDGLRLIGHTSPNPQTQTVACVAVHRPNPEEIVEKAELIWHNGEFVAWEDAKVHVLSHGLHYGTGVFEGVRCYDTERGPAIFRHQDHLDRLAKSAELYYPEP